METTSIGSMYELQDVIDFNGGKLDTDTLTAKSNVTGVSRGPVEKIYIETGGQTYSPGDIVVFDNDHLVVMVQRQSLVQLVMNLY